MALALTSVTGITLKRLTEAMCGGAPLPSQHLGVKKEDGEFKSPVHNSLRPARSIRDPV